MDLEHSLSLTWEVTQLDLSFRKSPRFLQNEEGMGEVGVRERCIYSSGLCLPPVYRLLQPEGSQRLQGAGNEPGGRTEGAGRALG